MANYDLFREITDKLIEQMEKGVIPWICPWARTTAGAATNGTTLKPYRGMNALLLSASRFGEHESPYFLTFRQAKGLGGSIRKGEKGTQIYFYQFVKKIMEEKIDDATGEKETVITSYKMPFLKKYTVFHSSQLDGVNLSDAALRLIEPRPEIDPETACEKIISAYADRPDIVTGNDGRAFYSPLKDVVSMPRINSFYDSAGYYRTLFHELAHSTGHETRCNRKEMNELCTHRHDPNYAKEELTAEMAAVYLAEICGIGADIENSASYLKGWIDAAKKDPAYLPTAASKAQKAVEWMQGNHWTQKQHDENAA